MIQLLYAVVFAEACVALMLCVSFPPFRQFMVDSLQLLKSGKGAAISTAILATECLFLAFSVKSLLKIRQRISRSGAVHPSDQLLMYNYILEASLIGFALFLAIMIDRLHQYVKELPALMMSMESLKKQAAGIQKEYFRLKDEKELKLTAELLQLKEVVAELRKKLEQASSEILKREKEAKTAEANALALRKQSEGILLEYDRLMEDNQHLRSQLSVVDRKFSRSETKKNT